MKKTENTSSHRIPNTLCIHFFGDPEKGKKLRKAVLPYGLEINIKTKNGPTDNLYDTFKPELVILDRFPESEMSRSVYYQLQPFKDVLFLALNDSPDAMKYIHINGLSFIKMIESNPTPLTLVRTICDLFDQRGVSADDKSVLISMETVTKKLQDLTTINWFRRLFGSYR